MSQNSAFVQAGQVIEGVVHVQIDKELYPAHNLTLGLYGFEHVRLTRIRYEGSGNNSRKVTLTLFGVEDIIRMEIPLNDFPDGPPRPGQQFSYPFSLRLPDWLPPSMTYAKDDELPA